MEPTEFKKNQISGQGVQQLHLSLIKSQPDTDKPLILPADENSMEKSTTDNENQVVQELEVESDHDDANSINDDLSIQRPLGQPRQYDPTIDDRLPDTVTLLTTPEGAKVYLIGTAHFSEESQDDVSVIIQAVQPHIVMIELCKARIHVLQLDEKTILEEAKNLNLQKIRILIKQNGFFNGLIYILLLNMSANITKQLGMAPGGEFRRAFLEAKRVPQCLVHLGDRPINVTLQRALHSLTWWQTITLFWELLRTKDSISKEDVERCKHRDLLEELLADMTAKFPSLGETFVTERDLFLTNSLQLAASRLFQTSEGIVPARVVGIVGIGHTPGMIKNWGKVKSSDISPLMNIPPQSLTVKILRITLRVSIIGAIVYTGYKLLPLPSGASFQSLKSSVEGLVKGVVMETACGREDEYEHPMCNVMYVTNNIPGKGINVDEFESEFSVGCMCKVQCLQNCPCVREHVNYINNRFNEEKSSKLILECNPTCSCSISCDNRLVQHGPLDCLQIIKTEDKGFGLTTSKRIEKNQFICEYAGEVIGIEEARYRVEENKFKKEMNYILIVSEYVGDKKMTTCIDPKYLGNIGRYCNHSCQPSAKLIPVRVENLIPRLCLFACRDINIGEEITFDYGSDIGKSVDNISETPCLCRSDNCIGFLPHHLI